MAWQILAEQPVLNVDETGHKDKDDPMCRVFRAHHYTAFIIDEKRSSQVLFGFAGQVVQQCVVMRLFFCLPQIYEGHRRQNAVLPGASDPCHQVSRYHSRNLICSFSTCEKERYVVTLFHFRTRKTFNVYLAAAATETIIPECALKRSAKQFCADHPFVFLIRDVETDSILFMGRLINPDAQTDQ